MSKHFSPFAIVLLQPRQGQPFPATVASGLPAEPLISEGMLFLDILELLDLTR